MLYGQPVYLFGLLLCVFCPAYLLKHIRDFGMAEKPMDPRIKSGAKGAVACRFVLWASRLQGHLSYTHIIILYHISRKREGWRGQRYHWPLKGGLVEPGRQCSGAMVVTEREL